MTYAIMINLDHETHPEHIVSELWNIIKERMLEAGFHRAGRRFTIDLPEHAACALARKAMEEVGIYAKFHHKDIYNYLKDFYGYDLDMVTNLLLPPVENIEVQEVTIEQ
jgi:hypothetical protein